MSDYKYDFTLDISSYNFQNGGVRLNTLVTIGDSLLDILMNAEVLVEDTDGAVIGRRAIEDFDIMTILELEGEIIAAKRSRDRNLN